MTEDVDRIGQLAGVVILGGGASTRMGTAKAELTLPTGEQLLSYHVRHASELQVPILIADNGRGFHVELDQRLRSAVSPIIPIADYGTHGSDNGQIETGGALVAIESALQTLSALNESKINDLNPSASWLLVISCDSLIPASTLWSTLKHSITLAADKQVICLTDAHHLYPLLGLYKLSIEPELKAYIDSGQRRVMRFIAPMVHTVLLDEPWQYLTNFNTPQDFERACAALSD